MKPTKLHLKGILALLCPPHMKINQFRSPPRFFHSTVKPSRVLLSMWISSVILSYVSSILKHWITAIYTLMSLVIASLVPLLTNSPPFSMTLASQSTHPYLPLRLSLLSPVLNCRMVSFVHWILVVLPWALKAHFSVTINNVTWPSLCHSSPAKSIAFSVSGDIRLLSMLTLLSWSNSLMAIWLSTSPSCAPQKMHCFDLWTLPTILVKWLGFYIWLIGSMSSEVSLLKSFCHWSWFLQPRMSSPRWWTRLIPCLVKCGISLMWWKSSHGDIFIHPKGMLSFSLYFLVSKQSSNLDSIDLENKPFGWPQTKEYLFRCANHWGHYICALLRSFNRPSPLLSLSPQQHKCCRSLCLVLLERGNLHEVIQSLSFALLSAHTPDVQRNNTLCPLMQFIVFWHLHEDGKFYHPLLISPNLASITFCLHSIAILEASHHLHVDPSLTFMG